MKAASVKPVRCAIYTRVSTDHGLARGIGIERLRDPPTEWSRQFEALGLNSE